jgi:hypothetical protein
MTQSFLVGGQESTYPFNLYGPLPCMAAMRSDDADHGYESYDEEEEKEDERSPPLTADGVNNQQQAHRPIEMDASTVVGALTSGPQLQHTRPADQGKQQQAHQPIELDVCVLAF